MSVNESILSAMNQIPNTNEPMLTDWILVAVTAVLVGVTIFYAIQTHMLAKAPFRPVLVGSLGLSSSGSTTSTVIVIENIGVGPALMIVGKHIRNIPKKETDIDIHMLRPRERSRFVQDDLPNLEDKDYYVKNSTQIKVELKYQNGLKNTYTYNTTLNVSDQSKNYKNPFIY